MPTKQKIYSYILHVQYTQYEYSKNINKIYIQGEKHINKLKGETSWYFTKIGIFSCKFFLVMSCRECYYAEQSKNIQTVNNKDLKKCILYRYMHVKGSKSSAKGGNGFQEYWIENSSTWKFDINSWAPLKN